MRRALLLLLLLAPAVHAEPPAGRDASVVDAGTARGTAGRTAINLAAGSSNAQANVAAIATGAADASVRQAVAPPPVARARDASARIGAGALAAGSGALAVNQAAGSGNAQANVLVLTGPQTVDAGVLAQVSADVAPPAGIAAGPAGTREARIDPGALTGQSGVLQINQTAGVGNASTNALVLQLPGGGTP